MQRTSRRRGAYAIEFALVLPVFIAVIGGIVEYGRYYDHQVTMVGIVRNAARTGSLVVQESKQSPTVEAIDAVKEGVLAQGYQGTLTVNARLSGSAPSQMIKVTASIPYKPLIGIVPTPKTVGHSLVMRMTDQP